MLICDRDAKWSRAVPARLQDAGIRVVQTPYRAPNAEAYAERFVRSIKEECLNRLIPFGERHHLVWPPRAAERVVLTLPHVVTVTREPAAKPPSPVQIRAAPNSASALKVLS